MKVFMEVTHQLKEEPLARLRWLQSGYDLVQREGRVFAVASDALEETRKRLGESVD